jgi:hypothetical protein
VSALRTELSTSSLVASKLQDELHTVRAQVCKFVVGKGIAKNVYTTKAARQRFTTLQCALKFCFPRGICTEVSKGKSRLFNSMH